jgi:hypothetical protein
MNKNINILEITKEEKKSEGAKEFVKSKSDLNYVNLLCTQSKLTQMFDYLNKSDLIGLFLSNRKFGKYPLEILLEEAHRELEDSEYKLTSFKNKNSSDLTIPQEYQPFVMSRGANRAIDLLNEGIYNKIFTQGSHPSDDVKVIYRIFFYLCNKKDIATIEDNVEFWNVCSSYLINEGNGKTGSLINNLVKVFDFSDNNIYKINKLVEKNNAKIAPAYFSKICATTGLFIFLIKDALEYAGIIYQDKKTPSGRLLQNLEYAIEFEKEKVKRLSAMLDGIYKI